jgi:hypothetical protein
MWSGKRYWRCRKDCPNCPGEPTGSTYGFNRWGWLDLLDVSISAAEALPAVKPPTMADVYRLAGQVDDEVYSYLNSRGIRPSTVQRYIVGKDEHSSRLTVPNVVRQSPAQCVGIKKRWLGHPPEEWIPKYTSVPGTRGRSLFNWNRLVGRKMWPFFLVLEGVLDVMLADQEGIPAVAPFGGGGVWDPDWARWFKRVKNVIVVADNDEAGLQIAERKARSLNARIALPPEGKDLGEAHLAGVNLHNWISSLLEA